MQDVSLGEAGTDELLTPSDDSPIGDDVLMLIQLPRLVACMEYLLGTDYVLCDMGARSPMPGIGPQEDPATRSCDWSGLLSSYTLGR